jgi:two-component system OmpR family response regulator
MRGMLAATQVLLVDDDIELVSLLKSYLEVEGFDVDTVHDARVAASRAVSGDFGIVVLDVMMPRVDGLEILRSIRAKSTVPVLMLTARGEDGDRIRGLELGADDYVPKPCTPRVLAARIRAILRRTLSPPSGPESASAISVGSLSVWPARRLAEWSGKPIDLTSTEFNLLEVLARNVGRPVAKEVLSAQALGRPLGRFDRSIGVHMSSIRRKLAAAGGCGELIETVHGIGYELICVAPPEGAQQRQL